MDIRITNTCNNNCLYCLEGSLRKKESFISQKDIHEIILHEVNKDNLTLYGGNPLLHPDVLDIIESAKNLGFKSIGILTNTATLDKEFLQKLQYCGLTSIGFYFNSFNEENHIGINQHGISLKHLIINIRQIINSGIYIKVIIHVNRVNIKTVGRDILILNSKFGIKNFEFINYIPFGNAYENRRLLEYDIDTYRVNIDLLFNIIKKFNIDVSFLKFNKDFFGVNIEYFNQKKGILNQIGEEDLNILNSDTIPYCKEEKRCKNCFLKYDCKWSHK